MCTHPRTMRDRPPPDAIEADMGNVKQVFSFGASAAAPSCLLKALIHLHQTHGRLPWSQVINAVINELSTEIRVNEYREIVFNTFRAAISRYEGMRKVGGREDWTIKREGDLQEFPEYISFLRVLAENPTHMLLKEPYENIGLEFEDIDFEIREPLKVEFNGHEILTVPPPGAGGLLTAYTLKQLNEQLSKNEPKELRIKKLYDAFFKTNEVRQTHIDGNLHLPNIAKNILGTTEHFSAVDSFGMAIACTFTNGCSNAIMCPKTGILFNNLLGEADVNPNGFLAAEPGSRFPSMMTPCIVKKDGEVKYILGSSGSERIRSAVVGNLVSLIIDEFSVEQAVVRPRVHFDSTKLHLENEQDVTLPDKLGVECCLWESYGFYFGGCHLIGKENGRWVAKGDPRRDGKEFILNAS